MKQQVCPCCNEEKMEADASGKVCDRCGDIIDFGYPSFPAFMLEEAQRNKVVTVSGASK